jgi:hypothetical protein
MYLIIKTQANGGSGEGTQTACAVVPLNRETLDYVLGMMDQAAQLSDTLSKKVALTCDDWTPVWYGRYPDVDAFGQAEEDALDNGDPGWCVLDDNPFPDAENRVNSNDAPFLCPPSHGEPVRLSYCEMRASANEVCWTCGPKYGDVEEYTVDLPRDALADLFIVTCVNP